MVLTEEESRVDIDHDDRIIINLIYSLYLLLLLLQTALLAHYILTNIFKLNIFSI
ncbi:unnamed protein product [Musa textilis]